MWHIHKVIIYSTKVTAYMSQGSIVPCERSQVLLLCDFPFSKTQIYRCKRELTGWSVGSSVDE